MVKLKLKAENDAEAIVYLHEHDIKSVQFEKGFLNQEVENEEGVKETVKTPVEFLKVILYEMHEVVREFPEVVNGKTIAKRKKVQEEKTYFIMDPSDIADVIEQYEKLVA